MPEHFGIGRTFWLVDLRTQVNVTVFGYFGQDPSGPPSTNSAPAFGFSSTTLQPCEPHARCTLLRVWRCRAGGIRGPSVVEKSNEGG